MTRFSAVVGAEYNTAFASKWRKHGGLPGDHEFRPGTDFVGKFFFVGVAATVADCGILPRNSTF